VQDSNHSWLKFLKWWNIQEMRTDEEALKLMFTSHPLFSTAMSMNRSLTVVIDMHTMKYLYWSGNAKDLLGWEEDDYLAGGVQFTYSNIHPDDMAATQTFSQQIVTYYKSLSEIEKNNFRSYWDMRMVKKDGSYVRILLHDCPLKNDADGNTSVLLSFITDVTSMKPDRSCHLRMTNGKEDVLYEYNVAEQKLHTLTCPSNREIEVFRSISQGYQRKQIADKLNISVATVKTHCQNVYEKLGTNDSVESINLLKILGLL
jgi:DNA-binding CsgD family transcriptional regulator